MTTMRLGVQLPFRIFVPTTGVPSVAVTGNVGPYQIDPSNGRIYFSSSDEDNTAIKVVYTPVDESTGNPLANQTLTQGVSLISESAEAAVPIEQAVNETGMTAFIDPFNYLNQRRPPLVWMFWSSTRAGVPDIYFQSVAPQWAPVVVGR